MHHSRKSRLTVCLCASLLIAAAGAEIAEAQCAAVYTFQGEVAADRFGRSVSGAGDVNNDGHADVIVGAWDNDAAGVGSGRAYVYSGIDGALLYTFTGAAGGDNLGWSVAGIGDVNADGFDDVLVGARFAGGVGEAYVYSGQTGGLLHTFTGGAPDDRLGWSVSGAGDVNNDGRDDLIVGAPSTAANPGQAFVYSGLDFSVLHTFTGEAADDAFGAAVSGAGDVNNDGHDDVIVGASFNDAGGADAGRAYVYSGLSGGLLHTFTGAAANDEFGFSVSSAGDTDADGFADVVVGAVNAAGPGMAYVYSGQTGMEVYNLTGEVATDEFGYSVAGLDDLSGDGIGEVIVGAKFNDAGANNAGRAYVYSGSDGTLLQTFTGVGIRRNLGTSVANAGDVDNNGVDDIIVGGPRRGAGLAHVYSCPKPPEIPTFSGTGAIIFGLLLLGVVVFYVRYRRIHRTQVA